MASAAPVDQPAPAVAAQGRDRQQVAPGWSGARSSRCRAARRAGKPRSNRPADRAGLRADRRRLDRRGLSGRRLGQQVRQAEQRDPEVLRAGSAGPRSPSRVVAEARVADGLELVQVVVGRVEQVPGGDEVVERRSSPIGMAAPRPADQPRRRQPPPDPTRSEERRRRRRPSGEPCRRARTAGRPRNWRRSDRERRRVAAAASAADGRSAVELGPSSARRVRRRARARSPAGVSPTATMCAWYQVVATWAVYQKTVPKAKKIVVAEPDRRPDRRAARAPTSRSPTSTAARIVKIGWSSVARPQIATNGSRTTAGSGGNGSRPRGDAVGGRDRQDVLEVGVAVRARRWPRPGSGSPPGPRGTPRPARRSGRSSDRSGSRGRWPARRAPAAGRRRSPASGPVRGSGHGLGRGVRRADPVLRSDPPSTLVQEPFPGDWPRVRWDRARHRSAVAGDRDAGAVGAVLMVLALGLALRLIIAYLLPGSGFEVDLGAFRFWANEPRRRTGRPASTSATSSTTTRPATCTSCGWSAIVGQRHRAASAT